MRNIDYIKTNYKGITFVFKELRKNYNCVWRNIYKNPYGCEEDNGDKYSLKYSLGYFLWDAGYDCAVLFVYFF